MHFKPSLLFFISSVTIAISAFQIGCTQQPNSDTEKPNTEAALTLKTDKEDSQPEAYGAKEQETNTSAVGTDKDTDTTEPRDKNASQIQTTQSQSDKAATGVQDPPKPGGDSLNGNGNSPSTKDEPADTQTKSVEQMKRFAITFNDLKFEMEKSETFDRAMLTDKINGYHGGKVKIRGYIRPNFKQTGITKFIFVRDNKECCFGPQAAIFDNILVRLGKDQSVNYTVRPVTVEGNFVLKEYLGPDGKVWSLYRMYDAEVVR
jgi:hypothetical protein